MTFVGFLNTFVHTVMYSYYLATLLFGTQKFDFLKKWITRMQLVRMCAESKSLRCLFTPQVGLTLRLVGQKPV